VCCLQESAVELALDTATAAGSSEAAHSSSSSSSNSQRLAPMLQALPPLGTVHSPYTFPAQHLPLLANTHAVRPCRHALVHHLTPRPRGTKLQRRCTAPLLACCLCVQAAHIQRLQATLSQAWEQQRGRIEDADPSLAFAELQHAMSLVRGSPCVRRTRLGCVCVATRPTAHLVRAPPPPHRL
jgi:hypothetical protein